MGFELLGNGFCMDSQNIYYDSFTASTGENGYDGTLAMCESRSASNPQSPGFAFSDTNACTIYMNNGQVPIGFEVPISGTVTTNYGNGPINKASGHFASSCYRKLPTTTTTTSTESVATSSSSSTSTPSTTTTTTTAAAPQGVMSSRYTETADAYCSNAMDDDDPSILSRYDSFENCWEYCASETSCAACFQPCLDGTGGGCIGSQGCQFLAVSLCSAKTADGCGARIWRRYGSSGDPMLAVRIVLIVVGAIVLLGRRERERERERERSREWFKAPPPERERGASTRTREGASRVLRAVRGAIDLYGKSVALHDFPVRVLRCDIVESAPGREPLLSEARGGHSGPLPHWHRRPTRCLCPGSDPGQPEGETQNEPGEVVILPAPHQECKPCLRPEGQQAPATWKGCRGQDPRRLQLKSPTTLRTSRGPHRKGGGKQSSS
ncbi:CUL1 [Symbiodinium necroappetens]|uniref:CUL1 protein n=1 Tax=Symbiodinium necroappetens TaxID=1628268 RepID=A0A812PDY1_9DINO|nr:CUL1 [Symbiodinium necroappetens]